MIPGVGWAEATAEVARRDRGLALVIDACGPLTLRPRNPDGVFGALVRTIAHQQLAGKAAAAIHGRVRSLVAEALTAEAVLALPEASLRAAGLSTAKVASVLDLACRVATGELDLEGLTELSDDAVIESLSRVRGIGRWSAEMFLLFELRRLDVWPTGDLGVRHGWRLSHDLAKLPTPAQLVLAGEPLRPLRSVAALYCWQAVDLSRLGS